MTGGSSDAGEALDRIAKAFGLDTEATAALLRVSPAELADWRGAGIPDDRAGEVEALEALANRLLETLRPETVPRLMRAPVSGGSGWSALDAVRAGHYDAVIALMAPIGDFAIDADRASVRQERIDRARQVVEENIGRSRPQGRGPSDTGP